jgi:hypothetical protein
MSMRVRAPIQGVTVPPLHRRRLAAAFAFFAWLAAAGPAAAEIEKILYHCAERQQLCPFLRASVTIPDGWVEDKAATRHFGAVIVLPKGVDFNDSQAIIYAIALYNRDKRPVADFLPEAVEDWKSRAKDAKIATLPELARGAGKPPFVRRAFEGPSLSEQGYELQAVTVDGDKDGNQFIVTITLSANSKAALEAAEPAYLAILGKY